MRATDRTISVAGRDRRDARVAGDGRPVAPPEGALEASFPPAGLGEALSLTEGAKQMRRTPP